jgi:hypothetical protein
MTAKQHEIGPTPDARTSFLIALTLVSLGIPLFHFRMLAELLESTRPHWGLMPAHYLFLRQFGELSACVPVLLVAALVFARYRPAIAHRVALGSTTGLLLFTTFYVCYCIVIIAMQFPQPPPPNKTSEVLRQENR